MQVASRPHSERIPTEWDLTVKNFPGQPLLFGTNTGTPGVLTVLIR